MNVITRYFKIKVFAHGVTFVQYFQLGQMMRGYVDRFDIENELLERGEIEPQDCFNIDEIYELNKNQYDRGVEKCIVIV